MNRSYSNILTYHTLNTAALSSTRAPSKVQPSEITPPDPVAPTPLFRNWPDRVSTPACMRGFLRFSCTIRLQKQTLRREALLVHQGTQR